MNQAKDKHSIIKMENVESMYDNIENNTVKQLRALAKSQGLKGYYKLNKANLIDLIKKHIASSAWVTQPVTRLSSVLLRSRPAARHSGGRGASQYAHRVALCKLRRHRRRARVGASAAPGGRGRAAPPPRRCAPRWRRRKARPSARYWRSR